MTGPRPSAGESVFISIAIGTGVLVLYLAAGLFFESWSVGGVLSNLTVESAGTFVLLSGMAIATFRIPLALYLPSRIITPLAILSIVIIGWLSVGSSSGIIEEGAIFGLSVYVLWLGPLYGILYAVFGGMEYYAHKQVFL